MSTAHNRANIEDVAKVVLMPGDPLRAKLIAENFLENPVLFNDVRGMLGYTGIYKGHRVSVFYPCDSRALCMYKGSFK